MFQPRTIIEQSRVIVVNPLPLPAITESHCGVLLLGALLLAGCTKEASPPVNVLLVVVDTLRQDHLGAYGYRAHPATPQLDRFAREDAVTLDGMIGVSSWTMPSMATLFTGQFPAEHGVMRMMGEHSKLSEPRTLAARFGAGGWETGAVQSNFLLQQRRMSGFNRGFQYWDDSPAEQPDPHRGSSAADVANRGLKWLSERDGEHPWFMYLHFSTPMPVMKTTPQPVSPTRNIVVGLKVDSQMTFCANRDPLPAAPTEPNLQPSMTRKLRRWTLPSGRLLRP